MNDFKIGDKVKLKKLSEQEFEEIYYKKHNYILNYNEYLNFYKNDFNKIFEIKRMNGYIIYCGNSYTARFFKEEVEKISYLKTKYKIIKELLKNE